MFDNRLEGGRRLAERLQAYQKAHQSLILALPRGGVVVGFALHEALSLPLDVFITRKLRSKISPEYALGALTETGYRFINPEAVGMISGEGDAYLRQETAYQQNEIEQRKQLYRGGRALVDLRGWTVLLVDDGIATGSTLIAAARGMKALHVDRIVVAAPVGAPLSVQRLEQEADEVVVISTPAHFMAVGEHYRHFPQVEDEEVIQYLERAQQHARSQEL